jgi:hypothetical protein
VASEYQEELSEIVTMTLDRNIEHGFTIYGSPDDHQATNPISGSESSIDVVSSVSTAYRPIRISVHTHPTANVVPSDGDYRSFLMEQGLYGTAAYFPDGWRRGFVIASQLLTEEDTFTIRALEVTEAGIGLSPSEQREWVNDALKALDDPMVGGIGSSQTLVEAMGEQVTKCTSKVEFV